MMVVVRFGCAALSQVPSASPSPSLLEIRISARERVVISDHTVAVAVSVSQNLNQSTAPCGHTFAPRENVCTMKHRAHVTEFKYRGVGEI
jgi:hypothetical protein